VEGSIVPSDALAAVVQKAVADLFGAEYADVDPQVRRSVHADLQAG
jgi:hypothetical protein